MFVFVLARSLLNISPLAGHTADEEEEEEEEKSDTEEEEDRDRDDCHAGAIISHV